MSEVGEIEPSGHSVSLNRMMMIDLRESSVAFSLRNGNYRRPHTSRNPTEPRVERER
jgi:hypothetical protein